MVFECKNSRSMHHFGSNEIEYGGFDSESDFREILSADLLMDPEEVGDELMHGLVTLNAALKKLIETWTI